MKVDGNEDSTLIFTKEPISASSDTPTTAGAEGIGKSFYVEEGRLYTFVGYDVNDKDGDGDTTEPLLISLAEVDENDLQQAA